jgi:hypothetical protein
MEPAASIIKKFGGNKQVSQIVGCSLPATYNWPKPRAEGGTDGLIPQRHHPKLLDYARTHGVDLRAEDFLPVRQPKKKARAA